MRDRCKHEFRPTTNNVGGTDGVVCIYCLMWVEWAGIEKWRLSQLKESKEKKT